jgi:hypothetical protein
VMRLMPVVQPVNGQVTAGGGLVAVGVARDEYRVNQ